MGICYLELLKRSWFNFKGNLVLLAPSLLQLFVGLPIVLGVIGLEVLVLIWLGLTKALSAALFAWASLFVIIDILVILVVFSFFNAMLIGMLKEVVKTGKTSVGKMFCYGKLFFSRVFKIALLQLLAFVLPLVLLGSIAGLVFLGSKSAGIIVSIILGGLYVLYAVVLAVLFVFGLFFINPIITEQDKPAITLMKNSFSFTKHNLGHVIISWLIVVCINAVVQIFSSVIKLGLSLGQIGLLLSPGVALVSIILAGLFGLIFVIIFLCVDVYIKVFVFNAHFNKNIKKA